MTKKNVHTVPSSGGSGWDNKVNGEVISHHHKKETAVEQGRSTARTNESEHVIHDKGGKIQEKNSYGNDPHPPKDKR
ncbi:DUF2188 domain-containing protein [Myxococcus qinghaiensis]|uniref:DUF2188 domain-containing protein n=1 Tax=Myxococcus qinghaiensis TaxID=2906758 RepID=UPI0020A7A293|nr:DUF2188 domain-containing protein [Myxococcus qinghaiensis]MCP3163142.1 DUF2188 domain-containing protein [Myxococcus qinghaiensis]